ncbi:MAG: FAD-binding protein [Hespellia sp.]|nr:FAD-binding protein [Hespellia sp.]
MKIEKTDVLVVGGGAAGAVAASAVLDAGKSVSVVFANGGGSEICGGAMDVMGVVPGEKPMICESYKEGISQLLAVYPDHVYGKCEEQLDKGLDALVSLAKAGGYTLHGFDGKNVWVPNMMGTFSVNAFVPEMMKDSVLEPGAEEKVLVIGVKGNVAFNAVAAAQSYQQYQKKLGGKAIYFSTEIKIGGWGDRRKISDGELADYLDTEEGLEELIGLIKTFCSNNRYQFDKILFPPALGYIHYEENLAKIKDACDCKVGEVEALGNSVTGYRFTRALYRGLEAKGANLVRGTVVKEVETTAEGVSAKCIIGLTDQLHPGKEATLESSALVLAAGGFVGGGIKARHTEVWIELLNQKLGSVVVDQLDRDAVNPKGQGFMRMGVDVADDMMVAEGQYNGRIYACGSILSHQNFASERSSVGVAVASAYKAGLQAAGK